MGRRIGLLLLLAIGCGGEAASIGAGADDGGGQDATVGADSAANDGGAGPDGAPFGDGGSGDANSDAGSAPDTGAGSDPHAVRCGAATCDTTQDACCYAFSRDGGIADAGCIPRGDNCPGGFKERCDEAADCDAGRVCCLQIGAVGLDSVCRQGCGIGGGYQLCRTNAECQNDAGCNVLSCFNGRTLQLCGKPTGC
jgi:hypothetical protein